MLFQAEILLELKHLGDAEFIATQVRDREVQCRHEYTERLSCILESENDQSAMGRRRRRWQLAAVAVSLCGQGRCNVRWEGEEERRRRKGGETRENKGQKRRWQKRRKKKGEEKIHQIEKRERGRPTQSSLQWCRSSCCDSVCDTQTLLSAGKRSRSPIGREARKGLSRSSCRRCTQEGQTREEAKRERRSQERAPESEWGREREEGREEEAREGEREEARGAEGRREDTCPRCLCRRESQSGKGGRGAEARRSQSQRH